MSRASKITLGAAAVAVMGIIYWVQAKQVNDRDKMHEGVIRDKENRKAQNLSLLLQQEEFTKALRKGSDDEAVMRILAGEKDGKD